MLIEYRFEFDGDQDALAYTIDTENPENVSETRDPSKNGASGAGPGPLMRWTRFRSTLS